MTTQKVDETVMIKSYGHPDESYDTIDLFLSTSNCLPTRNNDTSVYEYISFKGNKKKALLLQNIIREDEISSCEYDTSIWLFYDRDGRARTFSGLNDKEVEDIFCKYELKSISKATIKKMPAILEISRKIKVNKVPFTYSYQEKGVLHDFFDNSFCLDSLTLRLSVFNIRESASRGINVFYTTLENSCYFGSSWDSVYVEGESIRAYRFENIAMQWLPNDIIEVKPYYHSEYHTGEGTEITHLYEIPQYGLESQNYLYGENLFYGWSLLFQPYDLSRGMYRMHIIKESNINSEIKRISIPFDDYPAFTFISPTPDSIAARAIYYTNPIKIKQIESHGVEACFQYPSRQNIQSARIFILTMVMTLLVTWIIDISWKLRKGRKIRKRYASLIDTCTGGSLSDCSDCPLKSQCKRISSLLPKESIWSKLWD